MLLESLRRADAARPELGEAIALLRKGGLVAFPTETVYGLGADGLNPRALDRIFLAKGRPRTNPLILHVSGLQMARSLVSQLPAEALRLMEAFWPGPLTLVLPKRPHVPDEATAGGPTVALRMPEHPLALALIRSFGGPLAAPSANRSEHVSPTTAAHVQADLGDRIDLILDGGPCRAGLESTVVDLSGSTPRILRQGPLGAAALTQVLARPMATGSAGHGPAASPGLSARHYAPRVPLVLATDALESLQQGAGPQAWLRRGPGAEPPEDTHLVELPADPEGYGRQLYAALRHLETLPVQRIVADLPPEGEAWHAVRDRLTRAAAPASPAAGSPARGA